MSSLPDEMARVFDTRTAAYDAIKPKLSRLKGLCVAAVEALGPNTPEMVVAYHAERGVNVLLMSIRPRMGELRRDGVFKDSGLRGKGEGGKSAIKRALADPQRPLPSTGAHNG